MKYIYIFLLLSFSAAIGQNFITKSGHTFFKASVESFEPVEARNNSTSVLLNATQGEVAALLFIRGFRFKIALMEEHFNENYMESEDFPKAVFKGKIVDFDLKKLSSEKTTFSFRGELKIRGISKKVSAPVVIRLLEDKLDIATRFTVAPGDFGIEIPSLVEEKIAKTITIYAHYELTKQN